MAGRFRSGNKHTLHETMAHPITLGEEIERRPAWPRGDRMRRGLFQGTANRPAILKGAWLLLSNQLLAVQI